VEIIIVDDSPLMARVKLLQQKPTAIGDKIVFSKIERARAAALRRGFALATGDCKSSFRMQIGRRSQRISFVAAPFDQSADVPYRPPFF